jgi:hypothetical protein
MSSYKSTDLFGSGPHRFSTSPRGQQMVPRLAIGQAQAGFVSIGDAQLVVTVRGRLIADNDAGLDTLLDAINTKLAQHATPGDLTDNHGRTYSGIKFNDFTPADRTDRARKVSLEYTARFFK